MNRLLAFVGALMAASIAVSSACAAAETGRAAWPLSEAAASGRSAALMPSDLIGLEVSSFHGGGAGPIHFAVVRSSASGPVPD